MQSAINPEDQEISGSLAVVLPLAFAGFVLAAGCWTLYAVVGIHIRNILALSGVEFGFLLAVPMAAGALAALPGGLAARVFGARRVMIVCLSGLALCMLFLLTADSFSHFLLAGVGLGLAGGYYSAGLQFVTSHAPLARTGTVLGLFGAGIVGVGGSYYLAPRVLAAFSWSTVPLSYLILLLLVLTLLVLLTTDESETPDATDLSARALLGRLHDRDLWQGSAWFGLVAGSFLALSLWLPDYLVSEFHLVVESGAGMAQWFVVPGALAQILGGYLADRHGSPVVVIRALVVASLTLFVLSYPPMTLFIRGVESTIRVELSLSLPLVIALSVLLGVSLGCAMGALQRLVVGRHRHMAALVGGVLLLSACSVAFALPLAFGAVHDWLGVASAVFMIEFVLLAGSLFLFSRSARRQERESLLHPVI